MVRSGDDVKLRILQARPDFIEEECYCYQVRQMGKRPDEQHSPRFRLLVRNAKAIEIDAIRQRHCAGADSHPVTTA